MLPGFRFLLATVVLSVSVLVFAVGAAALLRAAHEDFASLPAAQAVREAKVAQERDARQATLALLRVEMIADQDTNVEKMAVAAATAERVSEPTERVAAPEASAAVAAVPDVTAAVAAPPTDTTASASVATEAPTVNSETTVMAAINASPQVPEVRAPAASAPPQAEVLQPDVQVAALADPAAASAEVATVPPAAVAASKAVAKPDPKSASKDVAATAAKQADAKSADAKRATLRRKAALRSRARARVVVQMQQQQLPPNDPFAGFGNQRTAAFPR